MIQQLIGQVGLVLAEAGPGDAPENNPEWGKAAPTGLFVLLVFVVACYFLFRSMNRHIRKVPADFGRGTPAADAADHVGEARSELPVVEHVDTSAQTRPRLGTPEELLAEQKDKRQAKIREAKARVRRDAKR